MNKHNTRFLASPLAYMKTQAVQCYPNTAVALDTALKKCASYGTNPAGIGCLEFDLVPMKTGIVDLVILGLPGTYAKTSRWGQPVRAAFLPYTGQSPSTADRFGQINADLVTESLIFTVHLTGCTIVAVDESDGLHFYHEPTQDWSKAPVYPGTVRARVAPNYDEGEFGLPMIQKKSGGGWQVILQCHQGSGIARTVVVDI
jgi:hypothetical protein